MPGKDQTNVGTISEEMVKSEKWAPFFPSFAKQRTYLTPEECVILMAKTGFELIYFDASNDQLQFANKRALIDWIRPLVCYISHLPSNLQEEFLTQVAEEMTRAALPTQDDSVLLKSVLFECLFQKRDLTEISSM
jgi:trans-aconitate methyltransferase